LTSLSFIGLVEARMDVLVMSAFNRNEHGRIGLQRMFGVMDGLVTRWVYSELSCTHRNHCVMG